MTVYDPIDLGIGILEIFSERAPSRPEYHRSGFGARYVFSGRHPHKCPIADQHGRTYPSINAAARAHRVSEASIRKVLSGKRRRACGMIFKRIGGDLSVIE